VAANDFGEDRAAHRVQEAALDCSAGHAKLFGDLIDAQDLLDMIPDKDCLILGAPPKPTDLYPSKRKKAAYAKHGFQESSSTETTFVNWHRIAIAHYLLVRSPQTQPFLFLSIAQSKEPD
jgi:hypothetical protein